jgi:hypothetical protein
MKPARPDWFWQSHRSEVDDSALVAMRQMGLLKPQAGLPFPCYRVCLLAIDAGDAHYWKQIEDMYLALTDRTPVEWTLPEKPGSTPWLAVVLLGLHMLSEVKQKLLQ